jgi:hypothetical protein
MEDLKKMAMKSMLGKKKIREDEKEDEILPNISQEKEKAVPQMFSGSRIKNSLLLNLKKKDIIVDQSTDQTIQIENEIIQPAETEQKNLPETIIVNEPMKKDNIPCATNDSIPLQEDNSMKPKDKIESPSTIEPVKSNPIQANLSQPVLPVSPVHKNQPEPEQTVSPVTSPVYINKVQEEKIEPESLDLKASSNPIKTLNSRIIGTDKKEEKKTIVSFSQAKKNIDEFCLKIEKLDLELKEKMINKSIEFIYQEYIPDSFKVKLIEEFFDKRTVPKEC